MERATSLEYASENVGDAPNPDEVTCDLKNVFNSLSNGLVDPDDVDLACYLVAYKELYNFFILLGGAFSFVASDVKTKINILEEYQKEAKSGNFKTVAKMIEFERSNNMLIDKKYISGSRTLLRLNRGLDFVRQFLAEVYKLEESAKTGGVCRETYDLTLGNFHPWPIRKAAQLAMKLLPTKQDLLKKISKDNPALALSTTEIMPDMLEVMGIVYQRVDDLYTKNQLHDLS